MEQLHDNWKLRFELVAGTQTVTSKWSLGSDVDIEQGNNWDESID
jgi:hypothetical protein